MRLFWGIVFSLICMVPVKAMKFETSDNVLIDYEIKGNGKPLVMLHSGMMSREDMRVQIDHFSNYFKVIAIDAREQGRSSSSSSKISYNRMALDVKELLDHLKIGKVYLFGQSDGGITGLMMAYHFPEHMNKLIIHGAVYNHSAYPESQKEGWKKISWNEKDEGATDPNGFPGMALSSYLLGRKDLSNFEDHLKEMAFMWATSPNLTKEEVLNIKTPTLVIVGDHYDISLNHTVEMHELLPNSELFVVPGGTHFIHHEKPDLLHKVIYDFLNE